MKAIIKENNFMHKANETLFITGWGNGYIIIPKSSPMHGVGCKMLNLVIDFVKDITFAEKIDYRIIKMFNLDESEWGKWMVGFHTCSPEDNLSNWNRDTVYYETMNLLEEVIKVSEEISNKIQVREIIENYNKHGVPSILFENVSCLSDRIVKGAVILIKNKGYTLNTVMAHVKKDKVNFDRRLLRQEKQLEIILN